MEFRTIDSIIGSGMAVEFSWSDIGVLTIQQGLLRTGLCSSGGDAMRVFKQNGIRINRTVTANRELTEDDLRYPLWSYDALLIALARGKKARRWMAFRIPEVLCPQCRRATEIIDLRGLLPSISITNDEPVVGDCDHCGWDSEAA